MSELTTETLDHNASNNGQENLANATAVLVLGICSLAFFWCYGIVGLICGIIALVLAGKPYKSYKADPQRYSESSFKTLNAGRICAIIGTCLSGLIFGFILIYFIIVGAMIGSLGGMMQ